MCYEVWKLGKWGPEMYKYKGKYYKVVDYYAGKMLLKEYKKVLWFFVKKKQKGFWTSPRELKKMEWVW